MIAKGSVVISLFHFLSFSCCSSQFPWYFVFVPSTTTITVVPRRHQQSRITTIVIIITITTSIIINFLSISTVIFIITISITVTSINDIAGITPIKAILRSITPAPSLCSVCLPVCAGVCGWCTPAQKSCYCYY